MSSLNNHTQPQETCGNQAVWTERASSDQADPDDRFAKTIIHAQGTLSSSVEPGSDQPSILFWCQDSVAYIVLNRPTKFNAIDLAMCEELLRRLCECRDDPHIRVVILMGAGLAFSGGGDLRFALEANPTTPGDSFLALTNILHQCITEIRSMPKPVIAAINGVAAGAGLFLALACDLRVIADDTYLKQSNTSHGLSIPAGGTFFLPRLVGWGRALEMVMLDDRISATQAKEFGLVTTVVPQAQVITEVHRLALHVAQMPIEVLGRVKRLLLESYYSTLEEQLQSERQEMGASANSAEGREGLVAFVQKRPANFVFTDP